MSSFYRMDAHDKQHLLLKDVRKLKPKSVARVVMVYRCPIRRFVSFFMNWAVHPKHQRDNNMHFHNPMKKLLGSQRYNTVMKHIFEDEAVGALKTLFSFIGPSQTLFTFYSNWSWNEHTALQRKVVDHSPFAPTTFINLDGGKLEIRKLEALIGHQLPHRNQSSNNRKEELVKACFEDTRIRDCLLRTYAKDYKFFRERGITFPYLKECIPSTEKS